MKTLLIILGVALLTAAGVFVHKMVHKTQLLGKESGQRALVSETRILLDDYKDANGAYPDSITGLPFTYPDVSTPKMLKDITYTSSGTSYTLKTVGYSTGQTIEIIDRTQP